MQPFLKLLLILSPLAGCFGQMGEPDYPGGIVSEVLSLITNGTVEHFFGCKSQDNITEDDIAYYLYTRDNENGVALTPDTFCKVDPQKDTKILINGWLGTSKDQSFLDMMMAYLNRYDCNVIIVEYINVTNTQYSQAYCNIFKAVEIIGDFLCTLHKEEYLEFNNLHIVGHSLGGHVAGLIGRRTQTTCNEMVDRITGLDPAGPIFQSQEKSSRLDKSDAKFVDVIHTNMGMFGYYGANGHVDFYPNCGTVQTGCIKLDKFPNAVAVIMGLIGCSHSRSVALFTESIQGTIFNATSCTLCPNGKAIGKCLFPDTIKPKYALMGEDCPRHPPAERFQLKTTGKPPYTQVKTI